VSGNAASSDAKSPLDRFLGLFAEVRSGEGLSALLLTVNVFLLLTSYYIMTLLLLLFVPVYGRLAARLPRRRLLNGVTLFFAACLVVFWLLGTGTALPLGVPFFLWIGIFSVSLVAQFWSFANDLYTPEQGKRLFAILGFGASAGAVFGATSVKGLIAPVGLMGSLLVAAAVLLLSLVFMNWVDRREEHRVRPAAAEPPIESLGGTSPYRLVFGRPYLLTIALLVLLLNWVNTTGEYILGKVVREAAVAAAAARPDAGAGFVGEFIGRFYGDFFGVVNVLSLLVQLFLVSRILKFLGVRAALLILPVIAFAGYAFAAFLPVLGIIRWSKTAENATDYSLMNTLKGVLFLPTTREEKYKAKQAIDTLFVRAGDVLSAVLVFVGSQWLGLATRQFALVNLGLVVLWLLLALRIGREFQRLSAVRP
jgi:AAA family ATP:ADP antiporter